MMPTCQIIQGDALARLRELPSDSVQCCVSSPPYWGLRSYGTAHQIWGGDRSCLHNWTSGKPILSRGPIGNNSSLNGAEVQGRVEAISTGQTCSLCGAWIGELGNEPTPEMWAEHIVEIYSEVRRVLKPDGVAWVNFGDCYAGSGFSGGTAAADKGTLVYRPRAAGRVPIVGDLKAKDLIGQPWLAAFGLRSSGWWLRHWIPWIKRNGMPESTVDRPTVSCETVFMLSKSARYFYDGDAVKMPVSEGTHARLSQNVEAQIGSERANGGRKTNGNMKAVGNRKLAEAGSGTKTNTSFKQAMALQVTHRNRRQGDSFFETWQGMITDDAGEPVAFVVNPQPYRGAHFATYPPRLIQPMILSSSRPGDTVLDPFGGSGTTGQVAIELGRNAILIELNPAYCDLIRHRTNVTPGLPL